MNVRSSQNNPPHLNSYNLRIFLLLGFISVVIALIMFRLFHLQVLNFNYYKALADNQHDTEQTIAAKRGDIYLTSRTNEQPLLVATNIVRNAVIAVPKEIENKTLTAKIIAPVLEVPYEEILEKLNNGNQNYLVLKKQLSDESSDQIKELDLSGILLEPETIRYYPEKNLASQVLGFLGYKGNQRVGQYGVEGKFESRLAGSSGVLGVETDTAGRWITVASRNLIPSRDGDNVYLTIDPAIQFKASEVLKQTVELHEAEKGSVTVLDPKTGAVLAMVNYPDFDPNQYSTVENIGIFSNTVLSANYEPGSVFKPLVMAAAINERKVDPSTTYNDEGFVDFVEVKVKNSDGVAHGVQNMTQVLEKSLNTGIIFVEQQLGHEKFKEYVNRFGFGKQIGFELPGEVKGNLDNLNKKGDVFFATASYGQGISVTPLQIITAWTALANGGKVMKPYVVDKIEHPDGSVEKRNPEKISDVIESKTAATVSAMLVNVVENGHGKKAAVPGYYIAGKTGTAQVAYTDRLGYDPTKNTGTFIGYGPVDDPAFLMMVRIDNPKNTKFAEVTAAPAFGEIASFILNYLRIPPTRK